MGAGNVKLVYATWGRLPDRAHRALVYMALTSLDADAEPRFWGGRQALAVALGRTWETDAERTVAFWAVSRAVRTLTSAGAIKLVERPRPRRNACYALNLASRMVGGQRPPVVGADRPP